MSRDPWSPTWGQAVLLGLAVFVLTVAVFVPVDAVTPLLALEITP